MKFLLCNTNIFADVSIYLFCTKKERFLCKIDYKLLLKIVKNAKYTGCLKKKYPLLTKQGNKTIIFRDFLNSWLHLLFFNLNAHTLHLEIDHQTPEIWVHKVKIRSAPETRGFEKWPSHNLTTNRHFANEFSTLTFIFYFWKDLYLELLQLFLKWLFFWGNIPCIAFDPKCFVLKKRKGAHARLFWRCGTTLSLLPHFTIFV